MAIQKENPVTIIDLLKKLHPGDVYLMAAKPYVVEGLRIAGKYSVSHLALGSKNRSLEMKVEERYTVTLSSDGNRIIYFCNCKNWSPRGGCSHIICAVAAIKKAVSPESLSMLHFSENYLQYLRESLGLDMEGETAPQKPVPMEKTVTLVIDASDGYLNLIFRRNGLPLSLYSPGIPAEIRDFWFQTYYSPKKHQLIEEFFERFGDRYPVVFKDGMSGVPISMDTDAEHRTGLHFDFKDNQVEISKTMDGGREFSERMVSTGNYLFDLEKGDIERIADYAGWGFWDRVNELASAWESFSGVRVERGFGRIIVPKERFNCLQFQLNEDDKKALMEYARFSVDGKDSPVLDATPPAYRLHVRESDLHENVMEAVVEGISGETPFGIAASAFWFFTSRGYERFSSSIRAKKRISFLYDTYFDVIRHKKTERKKAIRNALKNPDFRKQRIRAEATNLLDHFVSKTAGDETLFLFQEGSWTAVPIDKKAEARILEIPYRIFGPEIFISAQAPGEMLIPKEVLTERLSELYSRLSEAGVGLVYEDRPVEKVKWDFELDATRSSIDWFEIRPEIRCKGEVVDEAEFEKAIASGGFYEDGGRLRILDEESLHILAKVRDTDKKREKGEIVRIPRLHILDWLMLRRDGVKVRLSPEDERIMESLLSFEKIPQRRLPEKLKAELRHYQRDGYNWLAFLYEHRFGGCLADDMGLGKTIQTIAFLAGLKEGKIEGRHGADIPHLVVVPPSLLFNWEHEIKKFYPGLKVMIYHGKERKADFSGKDIVLASYDMVRRDIEKLNDFFFHVIAFDEAQAVKNIQAITTSAVRRLRGDFKLALTGTPVENHIGEYYSIIDLAVPGLLGEHEEFTSRREKELPVEIARIVQRTRPFVLRRTKQLIAEELPPKIETDIYLELTPHQKAFYNRTVAEVKETVEEAYRNKTAGQARIIALTAILKLRQICLSIRLLVKDKKENSPKIDFLIEQLQELRDEGHSALVFSQFTSFLDILEEEMNTAGIGYFRLDGSTPVAKRRKMVGEFQSSEGPSVFLISMKAGGKGLNLTRASYVFHLDPWWNPAVENQASDRAHRIGQKSTVTVTRLLMRHTVEEKMMLLKEKKNRLYKALLEEGRCEGASISREDFDFLIGD
jgi:non-specific serine/threonine protein kinase